MIILLLIFLRVDIMFYTCSALMGDQVSHYKTQDYIGF
jgi:hypothetical protein